MTDKVDAKVVSAQAATSSAHVSPAWQQVSTLVERVLVEYKDGTEFFDELDRNFRSPTWFTLLTEFAGLPACWPASTKVAVSGKFGVEFSRFWTRNEVVLFPGNLRHEELGPIELKPGGYIFLDDTCYRGRTFAQIDKAVKRAGGILDQGYVLYDGAAHTLERIKGIYRWRDRP